VEGSTSGAGHQEWGGGHLSGGLFPCGDVRTSLEEGALLKVANICSSGLRAFNRMLQI
jgi:hypothetical protein